MFDSSYQSASRNNLKLKKQIEEVFNIWIQKWNTSVSKIPKLKIVKEGNVFLLEDTRFDGNLKIEISKEQANLALFGISKYTTENELQWGIDNNILYALEGEYVPLATANPHLIKEISDGTYFDRK